MKNEYTSPITIKQPANDLGNVLIKLLVQMKFTFHYIIPVAGNFTLSYSYLLSAIISLNNLLLLHYLMGRKFVLVELLSPNYRMIIVIRVGNPYPNPGSAQFLESESVF